MTDVGELLEQAVSRDRLVGAQVAVLQAGAADLAQAGVRDVAADLPVMSTTLFEIGSVTKPLLASALLLSHEDRLVDLDAPVADRVPEFRPLDPLARHITARQLLSHTSGLAGDFFPDTGSGTDALAAFVELLCVQPLDVAPGTTVSYSNGGYALAGRLLERAVGLPFDEALRTRLLLPAGADGIRTWNEPSPDDLAAGHELSPAGAPRRAHRRFPRALTPAGGLVASASALAQLVRALTVAPEGRLPPWLPARSREPLAPLVDRPGTALGWGWAVSTSDGEPLLAHDGGTFGASSFVRVFPDADLVVVLLTNRSGVGRAGQLLVDQVLEAVGHAPVRPPPPADVPGAVRDPHAVAGSYRRTGGRVEVEARDGALWCAVASGDDSGDDSGGSRVEGRLELQETGRWHLTGPDGVLPLVFLAPEPPAGQAKCVVAGARAHTRVSPPPAPDPVGSR